MKNRGYAMSAIVYPILLICLILVVSLLFNYQSKQTLLEKLKTEAQDNYNVNSGIIWKTWLLKANSYNDEETLQDAFEDTTIVTTVFNSSEAMSYLKEKPILVESIKKLTNYESLVTIILDSTVLTNEEKYELGLPCYISKGTNIYSTIGNGYTITNKIEPLVSTNSSCTAGFLTVNGVGYKLISNCAGTAPYIYSNNYIDLTNYIGAGGEMEYYRNCPSSTFTVISNFGFSNTKGIANILFDKSYDTFIFTNGSDSDVAGGENHGYLNWKLDISTLNGNYYYKHYVRHNGEITYCSGFNIIRSIYIY